MLPSHLIWLSYSHILNITLGVLALCSTLFLSAAEASHSYTLFLPSSTQLSRKLSFGIEFGFHQQKAVCVLSQIFLFPFLSMDRSRKMCMAYTAAPIHDWVSIYSYSAKYVDIRGCMSFSASKIGIIAWDEAKDKWNKERKKEITQGERRWWWKSSNRSSIHSRCLNYLLPLAAGLGSVCNK